MNRDDVAPARKGMLARLRAAAAAVVPWKGSTALAGVAPATAAPVKGVISWSSGEVREPDMSPDFCVALSLNLWMLRVSQQSIVDETFRRPPVLRANFATRCDECDIESQEPVDQCPECGGPMRAPDKEERRRCRALELRCNVRGQSLIDVWRRAQLDAEMVDDGFMIIELSYILSGAEIVGARWEGLWHADVRVMRLVADDRGQLTESEKVGRVCLLHRDRFISQGTEYCPECGARTYLTAYVSDSGSGAPVRRYAEWEVVHWQVQVPSLMYGVPVVFTFWRLGYCAVKMEDWQRQMYADQRPPNGAMVVKGLTRRELDENLQRNRELRAKHPNEPAAYAMDKDGDMKFESFMPTPDQLQSMEFYESVRRAIGSGYGVNNVMMGDQSTGSGLYNEGLQLKVTDRAVQKRKSIWDTSVFRQLYRAAGIRDHHWEFPPSDEEDRMAALQREQLEYTIDAQANALGLKVYVDGEGKHHREGEATQVVAPGPPAGAEDGTSAPPDAGAEDVEDVEPGEGRAAPRRSALEVSMEKLLQGLRKDLAKLAGRPRGEAEAETQKRLDEFKLDVRETVKADAAEMWLQATASVEGESGVDLRIIDRNQAAADFVDRMLSQGTALGPLQGFNDQVQAATLEVMKQAYAEDVVDVPRLAKEIGQVVDANAATLERTARNVLGYTSRYSKKEAWQNAERKTGRTYLYRWDVKLDDRTSDECRAIWTEQQQLWDMKGREGLTMEEITELCGRHSRTGDPFWPHHNCRSSLVRAVHAEFPNYPPLAEGV